MVGCGDTLKTMSRRASWTIVALAAALGVAVASAQTTSIWVSRDHPAIQYSTRPTRDAIVKLNESLEKGSVTLEFDSLPRGYLASVLKAFDITPASQTLVFSENSLQRDHISRETPRAVYFNDNVAVGWAKGADTIEATVLDATQGIQFYTIRQVKQPAPRLTRRADCLQCHLLPQTHGVPGLLDDERAAVVGQPSRVRPGVGNGPSDADGGPMGRMVRDGNAGPGEASRQRAGAARPDVLRARQRPRRQLATASGAFDTSAYLTPHSDVVALMVLNHQTRMSNLLTRLGWQARIAAARRLRSRALAAAGSSRHGVRARRLHVVRGRGADCRQPVRGASAFTTEFPSQGPARQEGTFAARPGSHAASASLSLQLHDLQRSVRRAAFRGKRARLRAHVGNLVRCGQRDGDYAKLSPEDRHAIVEILRDTKISDLPADSSWQRKEP